MICFIAIVLLVANVYLALTADHSGDKDKLLETLSPELVSRYESIVRERKSIYMKGFGLGLCLSALAIYLCRTRKPAPMSCLAGAITLAVTYLFYIIHPKTDYMVLHLDHGAQRAAWLDTYRSMQLKYHVGLVVGIAAAMALGYSICC